MGGGVTYKGTNSQIMHVLGTTAFKQRENPSKHVATVGGWRTGIVLASFQPIRSSVPNLQIVAPKISVNSSWFAPGKTQMEPKHGWSSIIEAFSGSMSCFGGCNSNIHINRWWLMLYFTGLCYDGSQPISIKVNERGLRFGSLRNDRALIFQWEGWGVYPEADAKTAGIHMRTKERATTSNLHDIVIYSHLLLQNQINQCSASKVFQIKSREEKKGWNLGKLLLFWGGSRKVRKTNMSQVANYQLFGSFNSKFKTKFVCPRVGFPNGCFLWWILTKWFREIDVTSNF